MPLAADRNVHDRTEEELRVLLVGWEETPSHFNRLDFRGFLQDQEIEEVTMEEAASDDKEVKSGDKGGEKETKASDDEEVRRKTAAVVAAALRRRDRETFL